MNDLFKLSEHRLAKERSAQIVDLPVDDVSAHLSIARGLEKMMREKLFVESGGDFGEENRVIVILERLRALREPGVHRMPGLVRESIDVGEDVTLVIHQDVRRRAETAGGKSAAAFAFRFVTIAPAAAQTFTESRSVFRA